VLAGWRDTIDRPEWRLDKEMAFQLADFQIVEHREANKRSRRRIPSFFEIHRKPQYLLGGNAGSVVEVVLSSYSTVESCALSKRHS
jgi:hypothetical protein